MKNYPNPESLSDISTLIETLLNEKITINWQSESLRVKYFSSNSKDFVILASYDPETEQNLICIDHRKCFNKESQCPINVSFPLSRRKEKRLLAALAHLNTKIGRKESSTFEFNAFDEFGSHVRDEFYAR